MFVNIISSLEEDSVVGVVFDVIWIFLMLIGSPFFLAMILSDIIGFRFETSVLFDRNAGKVHVFSDDSMPWAPWRYRLTTYDWHCVRAEIDTMSIVAAPVQREEAGLRCVVLDRPGGDTVIDQFVLGINMPAQHIQPLLDTWEHVRRFMQREGPLFADQDDKPNPALGRQALWKHLIEWPKYEISGTLDMWKIAREEKSLMAALACTAGLVFLPFVWITMPWGFLSWLSELAKREPNWPPEIIASVGGAALRGKNLEAWRGVVPETEQQLADGRPRQIEAE